MTRFDIRHNPRSALGCTLVLIFYSLSTFDIPPAILSTFTRPRVFNSDWHIFAVRDIQANPSKRLTCKMIWKKVRYYLYLHPLKILFTICKGERPRRVELDKLHDKWQGSCKQQGMEIMEGGIRPSLGYCRFIIKIIIHKLPYI